MHYSSVSLRLTENSKPGSDEAASPWVHVPQQAGPNCRPITPPLGKTEEPALGLLKHCNRLQALLSHMAYWGHKCLQRPGSAEAPSPQ